MKTIVIIPAYNEEKSIGSVVNSIKKTGIETDILVINDGSSDKTSLEARRAGADVVDLPLNLGIGGAVQTGYAYAFTNGYEIAVQLDGDGQHDAEDLKRIILELDTGQADLVIGSRFISRNDYKPGLLRLLGIKFFSLLVSFLIKKPIYDTTSGFRGISKKGLKLFNSYYPVDYPEVETIVYADRMGLSIKEIPVCMKERGYGRSSISCWDGLYYMFKVTLMLLMLPSKPLSWIKE